MTMLSATDASPRLRMAFLGDVSLNGHWSDPKHVPFEGELGEWIAGHDLVLLNLESPVEGDGRENVLKEPRLATSADAVRALAALRPGVVVVGNNHIYDHLEEGVRRTLSAIQDAGAVPVGIGPTPADAAGPARIRMRGREISVLAYVAPDTHPNIPDDAAVQLAHLEEDRMTREVARERAAGCFVIVSLHWGVEFDDYPSPEQRRIARRLAGAGAGVVWGHHSHACQGWEWIDGAAVLYAMGNAVFDDVPGMGQAWMRQGRRFLVASVALDPEGPVVGTTDVRMFERPHVRGQPAAVPGDELRGLSRRLERPFYEAFYRGYRVRRLAARARSYFFGPGRFPLRQAGRLPGRLLLALRNR